MRYWDVTLLAGHLVGDNVRGLKRRDVFRLRDGARPNLLSHTVFDHPIEQLDMATELRMMCEDDRELVIDIVPNFSKRSWAHRS